MKRIASIFIALSLCTLPCFNVIAEITMDKEAERRKNLQETAAERFCKPDSNMTFNDNCKSNNSVEFGCTEYKRRVESEMKKAMQNYCNANKINTVFIKDEKTKNFTQKANLENNLIKDYCNETDNKNGANKNGAIISCVGNKITITCSYSIKTKEPASHKANDKYDFSPICKNGNDSKEYSITVKLNEKMSTNAKLEDICIEGGNGKWNDKKGKCDCTNSEHIFDEKEGCIAETGATKEAKDDLSTLESALNDALGQIKSNQT